MSTLTIPSTSTSVVAQNLRDLADFYDRHHSCDLFAPLEILKRTIFFSDELSEIIGDDVVSALFERSDASSWAEGVVIAEAFYAAADRVESGRHHLDLVARIRRSLSRWL